jgi:hydrogenase expression/formation protein HypE
MKAFDHILLAHGGGGQLMDQLLNEVVRPRVGNEILAQGLDSGILQTPGGRLAITLDGYVVTPPFFPGGDIGRLAISGTVNDLAVCGARPLGIALGLIMAEGLERSILARVMDSIAATAREAQVKVVTGDTKVVGRGQCDGLYVTTAGIGQVPEGLTLGYAEVRDGDKILINGFIADHGLAVMLARDMPHLTTPIRSDAAPLNGLIERVLESQARVRFMRDPTRAGISGLLADLARSAGQRIVIEEESLPVRRETRHAAEMLGLDVMEVANEGKVVMVVADEDAGKALAAMRSHPLGKDAAIIGEVTGMTDGLCELHTTSGGRRVVQKPLGEQLPRIC